MKRTSIFTMFAILVAAFVVLPSCKDDDEDTKNNSEEPGTEVQISEEDKAIDPYEKSSEKAMKLYSIANQLCGIDSLPDDWQTARFTATVSDLDGEETSATQTVAADNMAQVIARWNSLTGQSLDAKATSGTWKYDGVGSLTLTANNQSDLVATIDVDIQQIQVSQIRFVPADKLGTNASTFTPYYEYGDVVMDKNNCYWVCVRPANALKSKKHAHWVSLQLVEKTNIKYYKATSKRGDHYVPTNLGNNIEDLTYFAELIDLLSDPANYANEWWGKAGGRGLGVCDLDNPLYTPAYMQALAALWDSKGIWDKVTGTIGKQYFTNAVKNHSITCFYNGYSSPGLSTYMTLYTATFTGKTLSNPQTSEIKWNMEKENKNETYFKTFDIKEFVATGKRGTNTNQGPEEAIVVRHKETSDSPDKKPSWVAEDVLRHTDVRAQLSTSGVVDLSDFSGIAHYLLGDVYKDENGHRWFVVSMSGNPYNDRDKELAPYSELISFDGLTVSADGKYVTNLGTLKQTIRGNLFLHNLFQNTAVKGLGEQYGGGRIVSNIFKHTGVNVTRLYQLVEAKSKDPRNASHLATVAYYDPDNAKIPTGQPLLRYLYPIDLNNAEPPVYYWQHYVTGPDKTSETYPATKYSNVPIYLQDIAQAKKVEDYAEDFYSCQPLVTVGGDNGPARLPRFAFDENAKTISNYFYNADKWDAKQYPTDIWQEPVLMFRITAVYDRGKEGYSTKTVDGHTLTLVGQVKDYVDAGDDEAELHDAVNTPYSYLSCEWANCHRNTNYWDGKLFNHPTWQEAWK